MAASGEEALGLHWPRVPKITLQSEMCTSLLRQLVIAAFAPIIKEGGQDPSNFCHSCFHNQPWLFGRAEGQGQGEETQQVSATWE